MLLISRPAECFDGLRIWFVFIFPIGFQNLVKAVLTAYILAVKMDALARSLPLLRGPAGLRRSKFRETSLFLKKFSLSRVAFEKM